MSIRHRQADRLRKMYPAGRASPLARRLSHLWSRVFALGLSPRRWVTLEVRGRRSGRPVMFPLGMADLDGEWYLVSMLGERANWVRNVRAADGAATLRHGRARPCRLLEITDRAEKAPILKRYVEAVPGGRPHIPVDRGAPVESFEEHADAFPVFRVVDQPTDRR